MKGKCTICGREKIVDTKKYGAPICEHCAKELVLEGIVRAGTPEQDRMLSDSLRIIHNKACDLNYSELIESVEDCLSLFFDRYGRLGPYVGQKDMSIVLDVNPINTLVSKNYHVECPLYWECERTSCPNMEDCGPPQDRHTEEELDEIDDDEIEFSMVDPDETVAKEESGCPLTEICQKDRCPVYSCETLKRWEDAEAKKSEAEYNAISKMAREEDR
jgi:hypothetical protein